MDDRTFFDNIAADWDDNEVMSTPDKINRILDFFDIKMGDSVLDLGTGTGVLLPYIAERIGNDGKITAVDFSEGMLNRAIEKFKNLKPNPEFLNLDFENENVPGSYDKIILYCVYPHLHSPVDTIKWFEKVNLKDNGEIFIAFPCGPDFINNIHKEKHSESDLLKNATELASFLSLHDIKAEALVDSDNAYVIRITKSDSK